MNEGNFIGLGTAAIGRPQYININKEDKDAFSLSGFRQKGFEMLNFAYAKGVRYFDTAPGYGLAEQLLIDWLKEKGAADITVATKWGYTYMANFDPNAKVHEVKEHSLKKLHEQWKVSSRLLPYLKYHQIHSATLESGVLDNQAVLEGLFQLKTHHKLKMGLTTTGSNQAEVLKKGMDVHVNGEPLFEVFQCTYNVLDQSIFDLGRQILKDKKQLVIKEALANARLFPNVNYPNYGGVYKKLETLAKKYWVGVDAIALQFCSESLPGALVLSGANKPEQLVQNLKAMEFRLHHEEIAGLAQFKSSPIHYWEERKKLTWN